MTAGWIMTETDGPIGPEQHVRPVDDTHEHEESQMCWCFPTRHPGEGNSAFRWAHNAKDGRA